MTGKHEQTRHGERTPPFWQQTRHDDSGGPRQARPPLGSLQHSRKIYKIEEVNECDLLQRCHKSFLLSMLNNNGGTIVIVNQELPVSWRVFRANGSLIASHSPAGFLLYFIHVMIFESSTSNQLSHSAARWKKCRSSLDQTRFGSGHQIATLQRGPSPDL